MTKKIDQEYVSETTWSDAAGVLYEAGGIYPDESVMGYGRLYDAGPEATCPRCGQRFTATEDGTAESHRDLHFNGDEDIPSICLYAESESGERVAMVRTMAKQKGVDLPEGVAELIEWRSRQSHDNQVLKLDTLRVLTFAAANDRPVSIDLTCEVLSLPHPGDKLSPLNP